MNDIDVYIEMLRASLSGKDNEHLFTSQINWHSLLKWGQEQAIIGILWQGINKIFGNTNLSNDEGKSPADILYKPTDDDVMEWIEFINKIQQQNTLLDKKAAWITKKFAAKGFVSCLLKGQGNALYYPDPSLRISGDIDIWIAYKDYIFPEKVLNDTCNDNKRIKNMSDNVNGIIRYCHSFTPGTKACYHHIEFPIGGDIEVEVHYRPSWMYNPINNRRLQHYFKESAPTQFKNITDKSFAIPTTEFNCIYQLTHIFKHLISSGIGLRQIIDYYYLLTNGDVANNDAMKKNIRKRINYFGLAPIAGAMMWVLHEKLGLANEYMIYTPDEKRGKLLYREIVNGGNFGKYAEGGIPDTKQSLAHNIFTLKRTMSLITLFPSECTWEPIFIAYHFFWRKAHK